MSFLDKRVVVYGAGGHGKVVAEVLTASGHTVMGFLDDDPVAIGSSITGGHHGGLVVTNVSSVSLLFGNQTLFGGNATDVFCDSNSVVTGSLRFSGVPITNCANLLAGDTVPLP